MAIFNSREFVSEIAEDVVANFGRASRATTPGLKGAARENEVRKKLESLLPPGVSIGSGCIIDIHGNASRQQDIVLYERDLCPVFSINDTPETTYFPCEGVIAVGEIKSTIGKSEIEDSFEKIFSVKKLQRYAVATKSELFGDKVVSFRKYLNAGSYACTESEQFNQSLNSVDQIFGFILCSDFSINTNTLNSHISVLIQKKEAKLLPNLIVSLNKGIYSPYDSKKNTLHKSVADGDGYVYGQPQNGNFQHLIANLHTIVHRGRTVEVSVFQKYLVNDPDKLSLQIESFIPINRD